LRFDAIVGRNALGPLPGKVETLRLLAGWLQPGGRLSLAETAVRHAQRLYDLLDLSSLDGDLRRRVVEAEDAIYADKDDPLVNWEAGDLQHALEAAGFREVAVQEETQQAEMLIGTATLDRWFELEADRDRPSYAQHLLRRLSTSELAGIQALFVRQLAGQTVRWQTRIVFATGQA